MRTFSWLFVPCTLLAFAGCDCSSDGGDRSDGGLVFPDVVFMDPDTGPPCTCTDTDADRICDDDEGGGDLDDDGMPNDEDDDTDGDGAGDRREAGDDDPCTPPADADDNGLPDFLDPDFAGGVDAGPPRPDSGPPVPDAGPPDGGMIVEELCPDPIADGCMLGADEGMMGLCNGVDDNCDGRVDEDCLCAPGVTQRCFGGMPGRRGTGACQDGVQTCESRGEFGGAWGPCMGGIHSSAEACDDLDNDCNGCTDEVTGCVPPGSCPGPGDPRVTDGRPFSSYDLHGGEFFTAGDATSWRWEVVGTPCDRMFQAIPGSTATSTNGQLSYQLFDADRQDARIQFTLSGDYQVTLTVMRADGSTFTCTWIVHVRAPGLRVEACWDATGPTASMFGGTVDVDLHLGKHGTTPRWFDTQDCLYRTCTAGDTGADWGYPNTPLMNCSGPGARGGFEGEGSCPNPRLDIDNISMTTAYTPENINVDNPANGDRFRVMVHHYTTTTRLTHPLVTIYCGGEIAGTFGAEPDRVESFDEGGGDSGGDMWRVADVQMMVDGAGMTTGCEITPLHPPLMSSGYSIVTDDPTF